MSAESPLRALTVGSIGSFAVVGLALAATHSVLLPIQNGIGGGHTIYPVADLAYGVEVILVWLFGAACLPGILAASAAYLLFAAPQTLEMAVFWEEMSHRSLGPFCLAILQEGARTVGLKSLRPKQAWKWVCVMAASASLSAWFIRNLAGWGGYGDHLHRPSADQYLASELAGFLAIMGAGIIALKIARKFR